jgi:cytoskeletal protein CcmA (bactofilin family)
MTIFNRNPLDLNPQGRPAMPDATPTYADAKRPQPVSTTPIAGAPMTTSVISKALKVTGQLESTENIQIDGEVEGDVRGVCVKVGQGAKVKGTVSGEEVELAGTVDGKIEAKKVLLTGTAHMSGDVVHQDIRIESGAFIDGHCRPEAGKAKPVQAAFKPVAIEKSV